MQEILKNKHVHALIALLASIIIYKVIELIVYKSSKTFLSKIDIGKRKTITNLIINIIKYLIVIITIIVILEVYSVDTKAILASLGLAGLVIGLALQDLLKDIIVGMSIIFENQFKLGDIVTLGDFRGEVIYISLKTTKILSPLGDIKIIPNRSIQTVINHSVNISTTLIDLLIPYEESIKNIDALIDKIIKKVNNDISELKEPMEFLGYNEFSDSGLKIRFAFKTDVSDKFSTDRKIKKIIKEVMDIEKIYIPYNKISVIKE